MATNLPGAPPPIKGPTTPNTANVPPQPLPPSNFPNRFEVEAQMLSEDALRNFHTFTGVAMIATAGFNWFIFPSLFKWWNNVSHESLVVTYNVVNLAVALIGMSAFAMVFLA